MKVFSLFAVMAVCFQAHGEVIFNSQKSQLSDDPRELYLEMMKRCITNTIYEGGHVREEGLDWPLYAHSMIGLKRMNNLHFCLKDVIEKGIPGDFIETGVWRGGATILMRAVLKAYNDTQRRVWVADSFEGLPVPNTEKYPQDQGLNLYLYKELAVSLDQVKANFEKYDLLDEQVIFLKGWFSETLPTAPIQSLAVLRLDGDLYESTTDSLTHLYPKLSVGGYVIIDDYTIPQCRQAVHDFLDKHNIKDPLLPIDSMSVYWQKSQ